MHERRLDRILRKAGRPQAGDLPRTAHRDELEVDLRAKFRSRYPKQNWWWLLDPWRRSARYAFLGVFMFLFGLGACATSTSVELEVGKRMTVVFAPQIGPDAERVNAELLAFLEAQPGVNNVSVSFGNDSEGQVIVQTLVWGADLEQVVTRANLLREVPVLREADIQIEVLKGTLKESYAANWTRRLFRLKVSGETESEIQAQIMAQLIAQGAADGTTVEVEKENGRTGISITVEE